METVVKFTKDDDESEIIGDSWHHVFYTAATSHKLCSLEAFGSGCSNVEYEEKKGKITCNECISIIKSFKKIKI